MKHRPRQSTALASVDFGEVALWPEVVQRFPALTGSKSFPPTCRKEILMNSGKTSSADKIRASGRNCGADVLNDASSCARSNKLWSLMQDRLGCAIYNLTVHWQKVCRWEGESSRIFSRREGFDLGVDPSGKLRSRPADAQSRFQSVDIRVPPSVYPT